MGRCGAVRCRGGDGEVEGEETRSRAAKMAGLALGLIRVRY